MYLKSDHFNANSTEQNAALMAAEAADRISEEQHPFVRELRPVLLQLAGPNSPEHGPDVAGGNELTEKDAM